MNFLLEELVGNTTLLRFLDKFTIEESGCWLWKTPNPTTGYGMFHRPGGRRGGPHRWVSGHRLSYELFVGPIPKGLYIDHLCRNRACVNPEHLEPVTQAVNVRRGVLPELAKTHCPKGHPYEGKNLQIDKKGHRKCAACNAAWSQAWRDRKRAEK